MLASKCTRQYSTASEVWRYL